MKTILIFATAILASVLVYTISRQLAKLTSRSVAIGAVASFGLYGLFLFMKPDNWILIDVVVLCIGAIGGSGVALFLNSKPSLITFLIVASAADLYSFTQGATSRISDSYQDGSSDLLTYLVISLPTEGQLQPLIGIGDLFIVSSICFALVRLGYVGAQVLLAPLSGLLLAIVIGLMVGGVFGIPFIAATTILYLVLVGPIKNVS